MGTIITSRPNMTDGQIWQGIVDDCQSTQKTINCGSVLRRQAILEMDKRLTDMYEALKAVFDEVTSGEYGELSPQVRAIVANAKTKAEGR